MTSENYQAKKAKVDAILRLAGKWNKADYGEGPLVAIDNRQMPDWSMLSDDAREQVKAALAAKVQALPAPDRSS